eukprot:12926499-Prorocentrum_lima.AAC.1
MIDCVAPVVVMLHPHHRSYEALIHCPSVCYLQQHTEAILDEVFELAHSLSLGGMAGDAFFFVGDMMSCVPL